MTQELAAIVEDLVAGLGRSHRPDDRALAQRYIAALGPILARAVRGQPVQADLQSFERLLGTTWLVDAEPFQAGLAKWRTLFAARTSGATRNEAVTAHLRAMVDFVDQAARIPAEIRDYTYSFESFGSWTVVLRCEGRLLRVLRDGRDSAVSLERATARTPPFGWEVVASWRSTLDVAPGLEVLDAIRRAVDQP